MTSGLDGRDIDSGDKDRVKTIERPLYEIDRLQGDLEECRTQVFALLNQDEQVSEGTIADEYRGISDAVDIWVDEVFGDVAAFRRVLERNLKDEKTVRQMEEAGLDPQSPHFEQILKADTCNLLIPCCLIWSHLNDKIFQRKYPIGLSEQHELTVHEAEEVMEKKGLGEYGKCKRLPYKQFLTIFDRNSQSR